MLTIYIVSMFSFKYYINESVALPMYVYQGTTADKGRAIENSRFIKPRGNEDVGNWSDGPFGGNPSNPNLVYCCLNRAGAGYYAEEVCRKASTPYAAIVEALPDWTKAVLDEDTVHEIISKTTPRDKNPLAVKAWQAYAEYLTRGVGIKTDPNGAYHAYKIYIGEEESGQSDDLTDNGYAELMKDIMPYFKRRLSKEEFTNLIIKENAVAFTVPLQVIKVNFHRIH